MVEASPPNRVIVSRLVSELIPYSNNARTHPEEQLLKIAGSIKEYGFTNPVLIDKDNGIIAGHGRVLAAKKLNYTTVPCIVLSELSDAQRRAYVLADNQLALMSGYDKDMLGVELARLREEKIDLEALGFSANELQELVFDKLIADPLKEIEQIDEAVDFRIQCDSLSQRRELQVMLGIEKEKISFREFKEWFER